MLTSRLLTNRFFLITLAAATIIGLGWLKVEKRVSNLFG